ncbi:MAG: TetM/TetW/TetO/TetS family tetracycline resistance ribosomal protection protein [Clostridia bacterium]|nr:TetM/TetW/TetO/TetS family tetracycline resistance ribosomal protection protein [Clostridia bacterium]
MLGKNLALGILAHVDAGKTTLSEGIMYMSGQLRRLGRVDHRDAFLDTDVQERERGITIFSKQAMLMWKERAITLMDTPGHVDFSGEMERVLPILDAAVLVVSGADGIQGHTATLWRLLKKYEVPVFLFINKMDQSGADRENVMKQLNKYFGDRIIDAGRSDFMEEAAVNDEDALQEFLETGELADETIGRMILERKLFMCFFGSALKLDGVERLMDAFCKFFPKREYPEQFAAKVFKIGRDAQGARLTYLKVTGGILKVRNLLSGNSSFGNGEAWEEKVSQIRFYSGAKFTSAEEAPAGSICAVLGLNQTRVGDGLGDEENDLRAELEPVFGFKVLLKPEDDAHTVLSKLRILEEEDPLLRVRWRAGLNEIHVQLMGDVQLEVLRRILHDRFGVDADFGEGGILYKETIADRVEGAGHYEPLRHYAEVHLLMEPGERGKGIRIMTAVSEDELERNWQRLIITHLFEKQHVGVLTGSPITDINITLIAGRAHLKHTEGGDFRQATYRAVRHGLMQAKSVLLEPWYDMRLEIPADCVGRAMSDLMQMGGSYATPELIGEEAVVIGRVPVKEARFYAREVAAYTRGRGRIAVSVRGYEPCRESEKIIEAIGYDAERDTENSADSVFCSHGAGVLVKWTEAARHMHIQTGVLNEKNEEAEEAFVRKNAPASVSEEEDKELQRIFERTYGQTKPRAFDVGPQRAPKEYVKVEIQPQKPEYLLVDGYNIMYAWEDLRSEMNRDLDSARKMLMDIMSNFQGFTSVNLILVFDAYKVSGGVGSIQKYGGVDVVYTKEAETADSYIERAAHEISKNYRVRVATSDALEQMIIFGSGALRVSAKELRKEVENANVEIRKFIQSNNGGMRVYKVEKALKAAMEKKKE